MRALGSRRPQLPATSYHPPSLLFLAFLLLAFVARGGEPLPSASRDQGEPPLGGQRSNSSSQLRRDDYAYPDRETDVDGETVAERRRDVDEDRGKREEEEVEERLGDEEAEGAVKKRRRNDVGKSAEEVKEEAKSEEGIRRFDEGGSVIPNYFRKSGKLEEEEEEDGSEEEAPCEESSEEKGRKGQRSLHETRGSKNRKSSTVYLNAEEKRIPDGEQQSIVDGQIKRLISIRDDALDARAKADEMDEAKVLNFKREVEPEEREIRSGDEGQKSGKGRGLEDRQGIRLLTPDTLVYNILQDALETYQSEEPRVSYIDVNNDTLKKLVTTDQLYILRMAEKFLPQTLRLDYSEKMYSCVRRFEYYSCVKYIAWPMIKQYFPALPPFPDSHAWYPIIDMYPVFPPLLPAYLDGIPADLELPEVVDAMDDSKTGKKNGPEATIIQILHNVLKDRRADPYPTLPPAPSFLDRSPDVYVAFLFDDRSVTVNLTERSIPISYRARFVQNAVRCANEYDYLACFKYSIWPMIKRIAPDAAPALFPSSEEDAQNPASSGNLAPKFLVYLPTVLAKGGGGLSLAYLLPLKEGGQRGGTRLSSSDELETKMLNALAKVRDTADAATEMSTFILTGGNAVTYAISFTKRQMEILRLAEYLLPPSARPLLVVDVLSYLRANADFVDCARHVIWPTIAKHVPDLPDFPRPAEEAKGGDAASTTNVQRAEGNSEERRVGIGGKEKKASALFEDGKESRDGIPSAAVPVISVSGTRFVPIFTELPETVILNILRAIQFQSLNPSVPISPPSSLPSATKNPQFQDLLTEQQASIVNVVNALLPASIRPEFANKMIECLRVNSFLVCTRDVAWPILLQYFPWLPNFPNFGIVASTTTPTANSTASVADEKSALTEINSAPPLSETNVKTRQHGDTTVTITDTRFVPILNDLPETIILNILKAVQLSVPNLPAPPAAEDPAYPPHLTEHQISIMRAAANLLPVQTRAEFERKILPCLGETSFLECTRDVTWPTIAQTYPWLPNFPNFTALGRTSPQTRGSIRLQFFLDSADERSSTAERATDSSGREGGKEGAEERMEEALLTVLGKGEGGSISKLNETSTLSERQATIVGRIEERIPEAERSSYVTRMLDCSARYSFPSCVENIGWPILKRYNSSIPDLSTVIDLFSHLNARISLPTIPQSSESSQSSQPSAISQIANSSTEASSSSSSSSSRSSLRSDEVEGQDPGNEGQEKEDAKKKGNPTNTPSVGNEGIIPEYAGQPTGIPIDISSEKVHAPSAVGVVQRGEKSGGRGGRRERRSAAELHDSYYDETAGRFSSRNPFFPNITESEYLGLLIRVKEKTKSSSRSKTQYLVDNLNSTIRDSLTADQYEILKIVEDLDGQGSAGKGLASQTMNCILSLSFIRCLAIFVWPLIASNFPTLGILGRSLNDANALRRDDPGRSSVETEKRMQEFFAMSTTEFENELLKRKESIERFFLHLYRMLTEEKFETSIGRFQIKGYGKDGPASSSREGRGAKLKDNKNLPSILTIISDIMEEVLDQRPEGAKKEKEKRERSIEGSRVESNVQSLKDGRKGYIDIKRSMNDDEIITMFLDKIKSNDSDEVAVEEEGDEGTGYLASEDAYNAFEVLFGTKLHDKLAREASLLPLDSSRSSESPARSGSIEPIKRVDIVSLESRKRALNGGDGSKLSPIKDRVAYDFEKELSEGQEERRRKKRAKAYFKSFFERYSSRDRRLRDVESVEDNAIDGDEKKRDEKDEGSTLIVRLPRLRDEDASRKGTAASLSKGFKSKMSEMMPGFGLVLSFLLQLALAHARATASVAGMISNIALGTAMFGMMRDSLFGTSSNPKIKYVYDNDKTGPGISWPAQYEYAPHYYG